MNARLPSLRTRGRRHAERPLLVALGGIATLAVLGLVVFFAARTARLGPPLSGGTTLNASLADPGSLKTQDQVRIAGVRSGFVVRVDPDPTTGRAMAELKLDPDVEPLPKDTTLNVRAKGLLGARFVELLPGDSERTLEDGDEIRAGRGAITFGVPDALETFDRKTRGALSDMLDGLGRGMLTRGTELNQAIHEAGLAGDGFQRLAESILAREGAARRLVPSLESAATPFDDSRKDLVLALGPAERGLAPFVDRRDSVQRLFEEAPPTLSAAQAGLERGRDLLVAAQNLANATNDTLPAAPAGLRETVALLSESPRALRRATLLARDARVAVPDALRITESLSPLLDPLERAFADSRPLVARLGAHGCDIVNTGTNWRSVLNQGSPGGGPVGPLTEFRIAVTGGSATGFGPSQERLVTDQWVEDPYPAPCAYSDADVSVLDLGLPAGEGE